MMWWTESPAGKTRWPRLCCTHDALYCWLLMKLDIVSKNRTDIASGHFCSPFWGPQRLMGLRSVTQKSLPIRADCVLLKILCQLGNPDAPLSSVVLHYTNFQQKKPQLKIFKWKPYLKKINWIRYNNDGLEWILSPLFPLNLDFALHRSSVPLSLQCNILIMQLPCFIIPIYLHFLHTKHVSSIKWNKRRDKR